MTGADLKCSECGAGTCDVASDFDFDKHVTIGGPAVAEALCYHGGFSAVRWTCSNGHKQITLTSGTRHESRSDR
jgi:hypothetical protein